MRRALLAFAIVLIGALSAQGYWQSREQISVGAAAFQGPGDIVSGAVAWGSCARAYNLAYANGTNPLCDLVAVTAGAAVCTLRVQTNGFVDLTGSYCIGTLTPTAACAAALGGACKVTKVYDQTGNSHHWTQATLASMPAFTFSALGALPGMTCAAACALPSDNITQAQPFTWSSVYTRTGATTTLNNVLSIGSCSICYGPDNSANTFRMATDAPLALSSIADNSFHAVSGIFNGLLSTLTIDGSTTTGNAGAIGFSATTLRIMTANGAGAGLTGSVMEVGMWPAAFTPTQYGNMNTNQHSVAYGYNF